MVTGIRIAQWQNPDVDQFRIQKAYAGAPPPINNWVFTGDADDPRLWNSELLRQTAVGLDRRVPLK
jgi:hypothetical protein